MARGKFFAPWRFRRPDPDPPEPLVCVTHLRFLPCRRCDYPGQGRWSGHPDAVEAVRVYQSGEVPR